MTSLREPCIRENLRKGRRLRIVVVEDNISVAKGIRYYLEDAGHAVDLLHDGADARAYLRDDKANIVVLDINLPHADGLTILNDIATGHSRPTACDPHRARHVRPNRAHDRVARWAAQHSKTRGRPF